MTEDLAGLSAEALQEILKKEQAQTGELEKEIKKLEKSIEDLTRANERNEESLLSTIDQQIKKLKADNNAMAMRIEREDEFVHNTLKEKYELVLKEKEDLEKALEKEKNEVTTHIQKEIDRLNKRAEELATVQDPEKVAEGLKEVLDSGKEMQQAYQAELAGLRQEVEKLLGINSGLLQRVSAVQLEIMTEPEKASDNFVHESPEMKMRRYSSISTSPFTRRGRIPQ